MYKIFIDTNIILDFYRINNQSSINEVLKEIKKYNKYFISTEQSKDEFLRNRDRTIKDFIEEVRKQIYREHTNNIVTTLKAYEAYSKSIKEANLNTRKVINEINELLNNPERDLIYEIYLNLNEKIYERTDEIIQRAIKRKHVGNPPTSNKNTCGDEIIWETILEHCNEDLIIVTRDTTFNNNYIFLNAEYKNKKRKELKIVDTISKAIELNNGLPSRELEYIESDIIVEEELKSYGELQDNSNWVNIIYKALISLNGKGTLDEIYTEVRKIVIEQYPKKAANKDIEATVRGMLQRYSSDCKHFMGKNDLFTQVKRGIWALKQG